MNQTTKRSSGWGGACALLLVAGCSSAPLSFIEGDLQTRTDRTLYPVRVVSLDRLILFKEPGDPVAVSPGPRSLVLEAEDGKGARGSAQKAYMLKIEPCTRYFLAARRDNAMRYDWELVIERTEPVGGCNPDDELKKATVSAAR